MTERNKSLSLKFSEQEKADIKEAAKRAGVPLASWIRYLVLKETKDALDPRPSMPGSRGAA